MEALIRCGALPTGQDAVGMISRTARQNHPLLLVTAAGLALALTGCTGSSDAARTASASGTRATAPSPSPITPSAAATADEAADVSEDSTTARLGDVVYAWSLLRLYQVALDATGADLSSDESYLQAQTYLLQTERLLAATADRLGTDATLTTDQLVVSADQAGRIGTEQVGAGAVVQSLVLGIDADLTLVWQVGCAGADGGTHEITLDAQTGTVLGWSSASDPPARPRTRRSTSATTAGSPW